MGRLGVLPERALEQLDGIARASHLELAGVMTHISAATGADDARTHEQLRAFDRVLARAREHGLLRGWIHVANSAGLFTGLASRYDTVRPGIAAYGALPAGIPGAEELRPVMALRSQVVFLKDVPVGTPVGYGSTWRAPRPSRLATLACGYNDGVSLRLSGSGEVLLRGRRAPIVGRVSMDYTTVDVSHLPGVCVGDAATFIGRDGDDELRIQDVARRADTIPHELACSVGKRVTRLYLGGETLPLPQQRRASADDGPTSASTPRPALETTPERPPPP
jgi:alanine racemase